MRIRSLTFSLLIIINGSANACMDDLVDIGLISSEGSESVLLESANKGDVTQIISVSRSLVTVYRHIAQKVLYESGISAKPFLKVVDYQNAEASYCGTQPIFSITLPMLKTINTDVDALASIVGHEIIHLKNRHSQAEHENRETTRTIGKAAGAIGMILLAARGINSDDAFIGMGRLGENLGDALHFSYNRDQETEADLQGIDLIVKAGFNPQGAIRLQQIFYSSTTQPDRDWRSHHPAWAERLGATRQYINNTYPKYVNLIDVKTVLPGITPQPQVDDTIQTRTALGQITCQWEDGRVKSTTRIACIKSDGNIISREEDK